MRQCVLSWIVIFIPCLFSATALAQKTKPIPAVPKLTAADEKFLAEVLQKYLVDPRGLQRVTVPYTYRNAWGKALRGRRAGWFYQRGARMSVYCTDGEVLPVTKRSEVKAVEYVAACRARYKKPLPDPKDLEAVVKFWEAHKLAVRLGLIEEPDVVHAAWLNRLGEKELAAKALRLARVLYGNGQPDDVTNKDLHQYTREDLAWYAYAGMVNAFIVRADAEAQSHGERLMELYAPEAKQFGQAKAVLADLARRKKAGTWNGRGSEKPPSEFPDWTAAQKVRHVIERLDEVDARQQQQLGRVHFIDDWRVRELIKLGAAAVPDLIDVIEKDERLMRCVHFRSDVERSRTILQVREAALTAVMSILRTRFFEPVKAGDNFTLQSKKTHQTVAARLRDYWNKYGALPFDRRMMAILADPKTTFADKQDAIQNLVTLRENVVLSTMTPTPIVLTQKVLDGPNPAIAKFKQPTVAEAILSTMKKHLAVHDGQKRTNLHDFERRRHENFYLEALVHLGDKRIAAKLAERAAKVAHPRMQRNWAYTAYLLGQTKPFQDYIAAFQNGKITLTIVKKVGADPETELDGIVQFLANSPLQEASAALHKLADPKHPFADVARQRLLNDIPLDDQVWFVHPFGISILSRELDNKKPTGTLFIINRDKLEHRDKNGDGGSSPIPPILADPKQRKDYIAEKFRDRAVIRLTDRIFGLPGYHPLRKDADDRLKIIQVLLKRFQNKFRQMPGPVREALGLPNGMAIFLPNIPPLGRAATANDVRDGKAIFHLDGKGKVVPMKLPLTAVWQREAKNKYAPRMLIVQAERDAKGNVICGVISLAGIQQVPAKELADIKSIEKK